MSAIPITGILAFFASLTAILSLQISEIKIASGSFLILETPPKVALNLFISRLKESFSFFVSLEFSSFVFASASSKNFNLLTMV